MKSRRIDPFACRSTALVSVLTLQVFLAVYIPRAAFADTFTINTPGGPVTINVSHAGPSGSLVSPAPPTAPGFRPPTIFSAPLPSGSGARALGFAGAFTAVADDATAASWNPAGLIQLERPEGSMVVRGSMELDDHRSSAADYSVGKNDYDNEQLNYLSVVVPFRAYNRNCVFSVNYQEAYDFTQRFTANMESSSSREQTSSSSSTYYGVVSDHYVADSTVFPGGTIDLDVTSSLTTHTTSTLRQLLSSGSLTDLDFRQEGIISAYTYAMSVELSPKVSVGAAVNFYQGTSLGGGPIKSRVTAKYNGSSLSSSSISDQRSTSGSYDYTGTIHIPPGGGIPVPIDVPISGSGAFPTFTASSSSEGRQGTEFEGVFEEINEYSSMRGINGTFGVLCTVSRSLSLGFDVDLPWSVEGTQTRTIRNTINTYDSSKTRVLNSTTSEEVESKSVQYSFPLYWALGGVWRWNNNFYTTIDVTESLWSDFSFQAGTDPKLNPLDGSLYGENSIPDCWSVHCGAEYLLVFPSTEVPLRAGVSWEQRPAIGDPDEYWGVSIGSGISIGQDPGKLILDIAYMYSIGKDVLKTLVPDQEGLSTDVVKHQIYLSGIMHF